MTVARSKGPFLKRIVGGSVASLVAVALVSGCGDEVKEIEQQVKYPEMMATWAGSCTDDPIFDSASARRYYILSGNSATEVLELYSDGDCQQPAIRLNYEGDLTVEGDTPNVPGAQRVRIVERQATLESLSSSGSDLLQAVNACGSEAWPVGVKRNVSAQAGDVNCPISSVPIHKETLVKIEEDSLFFGSTWLEGNDIDNALTEIDRGSPFQRVSKDLD